jgi:hypothetical protein
MLLRAHACPHAKYRVSFTHFTILQMYFRTEFLLAYYFICYVIVALAIFIIFFYY